MNPDLFGGKTLEEAKAYLRKNWEKGAACPCCTQLVKLYKRKLNSGMARVLIEIYNITQQKRPADGWLHVSKECADRKLAATDMEYSKLKYWGLIEPRKDDPETGARTSGFWRITRAGRHFVENLSTAPKHIYLYNQKLFKTGSATTTIKEALGNKFNYTELMK